MAATKSAKKTPRKKRQTTWGCDNPERAFDLKTLVNMLETEPGFAPFFFSVLKNALANDPASIRCLQSYLLPTDQELMDLGVPASGVGGKKKCTDVGLLVAVIAQDYAKGFKKVRSRS
jgi:hypothetical protein